MKKFSQILKYQEVMERNYQMYKQAFSILSGRTEDNSDELIDEAEEYRIAERKTNEEWKKDYYANLLEKS